MTRSLADEPQNYPGRLWASGGLAGGGAERVELRHRDTPIPYNPLTTETAQQVLTYAPPMICQTSVKHQVEQILYVPTKNTCSVSFEDAAALKMDSIHQTTEPANES